MRVKNKIILFDLHGVLIKYSVFELIKKFLKYNKKINLTLCFLDPRVLVRCLYLLKKENVVEKVAFQLIEEFPKLKKHQDFILEGINAQVIKKGAQKLLDKSSGFLATENKIYIFSNIGQESIKILTQKYPEFFANFDGIFYTKKSENYLCKANKEHFEKVIKNFNINDLIFIDDKEENIKQAKKFNIKTIKFTSFAQLKKDLNIAEM